MRTSRPSVGPTPPGLSVTRSGRPLQNTGLVQEEPHLVRIEDVLDDEETGLVHEVPCLSDEIVQVRRTLKGPRDVQRLAVGIPEVGRVGVEDRATVVEGAEGGLPAHEPQGLAPRGSHPTAVEEPRRGVQISGEPDERLQVQVDHRVGPVRSLDHLHRSIPREVGVGAGRSAQAQRTQSLHVGPGQRPVARGDPPGEVLAVEVGGSPRGVGREASASRSVVSVTHGHSVAARLSRCTEEW